MDFTTSAVREANDAYYKRKAQAAAAFRDRRFVDYVLTYEPRYQFAALERVVGLHMKLEERLQLLRVTFEHAWALWPNISGWRTLLRPFVGKDAWQTLQGLPDALTMYRGGKASGITWTISESRAIEFCKRHTYRSKNGSALHKVTVPVSQLVASFAPGDYIWLPPLGRGPKIEHLLCP